MLSELPVELLKGPHPDGVPHVVASYVVDGDETLVDLEEVHGLSGALKRVMVRALAARSPLGSDLADWEDFGHLEAARALVERHSPALAATGDGLLLAFLTLVVGPEGLSFVFPGEHRWPELELPGEPVVGVFERPPDEDGWIILQGTLGTS